MEEDRNYEQQGPELFKAGLRQHNPGLVRDVNSDLKA